ncbi:MAG TPA: hypothetical protein VFK05_16595 [Polyangiaceae bacterium]|nr:hypothetical protein [Polyangiaceae bacterium]
MSDKSGAGFLYDQLEAWSSARPGPVVSRQRSEGVATPPNQPFFDDGDTEPSVDVQLLRDALRAGLK